MHGAVVGGLGVHEGAGGGRHRDRRRAHEPDQEIERVDAGRHQHAAAARGVEVPRAPVWLHPKLDERAGTRDWPAEVAGIEDLARHQARQREM
jgi:hypothetical protein